LALAPLGLLLAIGKRLPPRVSGAALGSSLAGVAAGTTTLGVIYALFDFPLAAQAPDPNLVLILVIGGILMMMHSAMLKAEAEAATYVIGRGAAHSSRFREQFAFIGASVGHVAWWLIAGWVWPDKFSEVFLYTIVPSALFGGAGAAIGAAIAPTER
jgi:hypothetical protein